ncbi:MAG: GNAT family N-acetyltransferase, partial [Gammaproteobacteria bacterium]
IEGQEAFISYQRRADRLVLDHTWVPPEWRGRGIAAGLARVALDYARSESLTVVPECPYVAAFIRRHPEYRDLVTA